MLSSYDDSISEALKYVNTLRFHCPPGSKSELINDRDVSLIFSLLLVWDTLVKWQDWYISPVSWY